MATFGFTTAEETEDPKVRTKGNIHVFWGDKECILRTDYLLKGQTFNVECYCNFCRLSDEVKEKPTSKAVSKDAFFCRTILTLISLTRR